MPKNLQEAGNYFGQWVRNETYKTKDSSGVDVTGIKIHFKVTHSCDTTGNYVNLMEDVYVYCRFSFSTRAKSFSIPKLRDLGFNGSFSDPHFTREDHWIEEGEQIKCTLGKYPDGTPCNFWDIISLESDLKKFPVPEPTAQDIADMTAMWQQAEADNGATIPF